MKKKNCWQLRIRKCHKLNHLTFWRSVKLNRETIEDGSVSWLSVSCVDEKKSKNWKMFRAICYRNVAGTLTRTIGARHSSFYEPDYLDVSRNRFSVNSFRWKFMTLIIFRHWNQNSQFIQWSIFKFVDMIFRFWRATRNFWTMQLIEWNWMLTMGKSWERP